jgi:hypothetical protein
MTDPTESVIGVQLGGSWGGTPERRSNLPAVTNVRRIVTVLPNPASGVGKEAGASTNYRPATDDGEGRPRSGAHRPSAQLNTGEPALGL